MHIESRDKSLSLNFCFIIEYPPPVLQRKVLVGKITFWWTISWCIYMFLYMFLTFFYAIQLKPTKETETCFNHTFLIYPDWNESLRMSHVSYDSYHLNHKIWLKSNKLNESGLKYCFSIPEALTTIELSSLMIPIWAKISVFINASFGFIGFHDVGPSDWSMMIDQWKPFFLFPWWRSRNFKCSQHNW